MKHYLLPEDLRNDVLTYLMGRPYMETAKGIQRLETLVPLPADKMAKVMDLLTTPSGVDKQVEEALLLLLKVEKSPAIKLERVRDLVSRGLISNEAARLVLDMPMEPLSDNPSESSLSGKINDDLSITSSEARKVLATEQISAGKTKIVRELYDEGVISRSAAAIIMRSLIDQPTATGHVAAPCRHEVPPAMVCDICDARTANVKRPPSPTMETTGTDKPSVSADHLPK